MTGKQQHNLQLFMTSLRVKKQVKLVVYTNQEIEAAKKVLHRIQKVTARINISAGKLVPKIIQES